VLCDVLKLRPSFITPLHTAESPNWASPFVLWCGLSQASVHHGKRRPFFVFEIYRDNQSKSDENIEKMRHLIVQAIEMDSLKNDKRSNATYQ
jgi:hypothetical protein